MTLSSDDAQANQARAIELVEKTIEGLGIDVEAARGAGGRGVQYYSLRRGSADVVVSVIAADDSHPDATLRVVAPVVRVTEGGDWAGLYEWLLRANAGELRGAAFGVVKNDVVVVSEGSAADLDASEVASMVRTVGAAADRYDDALARQFGTPRSSDPE